MEMKITQRTNYTNHISKPLYPACTEKYYDVDPLRRKYIAFTYNSII